jgi:AbrB family looped-hinge helix DNA binding protein
VDTTKLSSKGQVVLPKSVRDAYGWTEGTEFFVEDSARGVLLRPKKAFRVTLAADVFGRLKYTGAPKTLEAMNEGVRRALRQRFRRGKKF